MPMTREALARRYRRMKWIARRTITKMRHGWGCMDRLPVIFANAIPKSGSNLLFNIVRGLAQVGPFVDSGLPVIKPYTEGKPTSLAWIRRELDLLRPGDIRCGYLYADARNIAALSRPNWASYLIIRDPRDNIVSKIYYALDIHPGHALHDYLHSMSSMERRINIMIDGIPDGELQRVGIAGHYARFLPWLDQPHVCVLRFEELVQTPELALGRALDHLAHFGFQPAMPREKAIAILKRHMDPTRSNTFRRGRTGSWPRHFTPGNKRRFKEAAGDLLVRLGYEADQDW